MNTAANDERIIRAAERQATALERIADALEDGNERGRVAAGQGLLVRLENSEVPVRVVNR